MAIYLSVRKGTSLFVSGVWVIGLEFASSLQFSDSGLKYYFGQILGAFLVTFGFETTFLVTGGGVFVLAIIGTFLALGVGDAFLTIGGGVTFLTTGLTFFYLFNYVDTEL